MKAFVDSIKMGFASIFARKGRSILSVLGIVVGILTVASLLTLALSVKAEITKNIEGLGSNLVAVVPGKIEDGNSFFIAQFGASTLTEEDFLSITFRIPEAKNLSLFTVLAGTVKNSHTKLETSLIAGGSPGSENVLNLKLAGGRFIEEADETGKARVVVLGSKAAGGLFGSENPLGREIEIRGERFLVVGFLKAVPTSLNFGPDQNDMIFMPIHTAWEVTNTKQIFRIMMQAPTASSTNELRDKVKQILLESHKGEEDFTVLTQDDLVGMVGNVLTILTAMLSSIAAISLLVGGIGIMNIMLVSVSERTREIGIRKAVGATSYIILLQFLIEAILLTLGGGIIAVILYTIGIKIAGVFSPIPLNLDFSVLILSLSFSILVGIIFGVIPAYHASRKDPIQALRYE